MVDVSARSVLNTYVTRILSRDSSSFKSQSYLVERHLLCPRLRKALERGISDAMDTIQFGVLQRKSVRYNILTTTIPPLYHNLQIQQIDHTHLLDSPFA
jgi:hypothetical protein